MVFGDFRLAVAFPTVFWFASEPWHLKNERCPYPIRNFWFIMVGQCLSIISYQQRFATGNKRQFGYRCSCNPTPMCVRKSETTQFTHFNCQFLVVFQLLPGFPAGFPGLQLPWPWPRYLGREFAWWIWQWQGATWKELRSSAEGFASLPCRCILPAQPMATQLLLFITCLFPTAEDAPTEDFP